MQDREKERKVPKMVNIQTHIQGIKKKEFPKFIRHAINKIE